MNPTARDPEQYGGHDAERNGEVPARRRPSRDALPNELVPQAGAKVRVVRLISGDLRITVNPVDGSEAEPCPPGVRPETPVRRTAEERAARERAAEPPVPPGPPAPQLPLLERQEERGRLVRLLTRGRSARLSGPAGSGRTALLEAVAAECAELAPDGVVRLSGHRRTAPDLLYALYETVYDATLYRPEREELLGALSGIGAVVVVDDLEFDGAALDELLEATPECAFLFGTTPDVAADAELDEVTLAGLSRAAATDLLGRVAGRPLTDEESNWSGDLWFESEGLPLRFVQAGALLRQRDQLREIPDDFDEYGAFEERPAGAPPVPLVPVLDDEVPLPSIGEAAAPALLLASRLSEAAREALRFAVALGGEVPHQAHLPALIGHTHADAALGELAGVGLLSPAGSRYRLAAGVQLQLELGGYAEGAEDRARTVADHYAWWVKHPSVSPARAVAEADAVLAAMAALLPGGSPEAAPAVVRLARSAGPAFAAALHWGAWERALRVGQEASRLGGEVAEEAYFHHELGILALCSGHLDRARAELEASIGLRGALADRSGAVAGRRALALVTDRSGALLPGAMSAGTPAESAAGARGDGAATEVLPALTPLPALPRQTLVVDELVPVTRAVPVPGKGGRSAGVKALGRTVVDGARRNLVAVGAGALLVAVLGTVVTLGAAAGSEETGNRSVTPGHSAEEGDEESTVPSEGTPAEDDGAGGGSAPTGSASVQPGPSGTPAPDATGTPSPGSSSGTAQSPAPGTTSPTATDSGSTATKPPAGGSSSSTSSPTGSASTSPDPTPTGDDSEPPTPTPTGTSTGEPTEGGDGGAGGGESGGGEASASASGTAEASPWGSPGTATATPDGA
ncbi:ATP-binding protein [Streptomyces sp. NBC_00102]|uniref:ATP-binding protein n=1 Tax=Streptomyces sp. NBC_00102 TaxID=2975652 RepID=UPI002252CB69|nr:ATP-binding protein [Streptomyces sp. NBC_00102]MCX5399776.1 ATP-binding protein [Streptomyces sp. NBC_00102]